MSELSLHGAGALTPGDMYQQQATTLAYDSQIPASAQQQATDTAYSSGNVAAAHTQATASAQSNTAFSTRTRPDNRHINHAVSRPSPSSDATQAYASAEDSSALRARQTSGADALTSQQHSTNSPRNTWPDDSINSMPVPATRHYSSDGVVPNGTSQHLWPESTPTAVEEMSEHFDMFSTSRGSSTTTAAAPQAASSNQPHTQLLGHDEQPPLVQHQQQPCLSAATGNVLGNSTCIPTNSSVTLISTVSNAEDEVQDEAAAQQQGKKPVKAETIAFQENFAQAAANTLVGSRALNTAGVSQRSAAWMAMRDSRLTASAFANALG